MCVPIKAGQLLNFYVTARSDANTMSLSTYNERVEVVSYSSSRPHGSSFILNGRTNDGIDGQQ